ncbi:HlyD family secretion protein [Pseudomonas luteola]
MKTSNAAQHSTAIGLACLAIVVAAAGYFFSSTATAENTNDAFVDADFTFIAPKVNGFIEEVLVEDNQAVKAGQLLARIDNKNYQVELIAAKASVATSEAKLNNAVALLKRQRAEVRQVQANIESDMADVDFARHEFDRYKTLADQGAGTIQNAQQARTRLLKAEAQLNNRKALLDSTKTQIEVLEASEQSATAELEHAKAMLGKAELNISYTELKAPFDGIVGRRSVRKGAFVKPGELLMAVVPTDNFYITANFREVQLTHMHPGQSAEIKVDSFPGKKLYGTVDSIAPATGVTFAAIAPDNATGNFTKVVQRIPVKILLSPDQPLTANLKVGMSVDTTIDTADMKGGK